MTLVWRDVPLIPSRLVYYLVTFTRMVRGLSTFWCSVATAVVGRTPSKPITLRSGEKFNVRSPMDIWCVVETWLNRIYEDGDCALVNPSYVIDIGGGIGDFSIRASKLFPQARIVVFEPHPDSAALLRRNLALNNCNAIELHEAAVSGGARHITLYSPRAATALDSSAVSTHGEGALSSVTAAVPLAEILAPLSSERVFIKLDAEGVEFELFRSLPPEHWRCVVAVAMEYHEFTSDMRCTELQSILESNGLSCRRVPSPVHAHIGYLYAIRTDH